MRKAPVTDERYWVALQLVRVTKEDLERIAPGAFGLVPIYENYNEAKRRHPETEINELGPKKA